MTTPVPAGRPAVPVPATPVESNSATTSPAARRRRLDVIPRSLVMLLGAGAAVLVLAGVRATAWLIGPMFLALIMVIALYPVQTWLRRHNWPGWLTTSVLVLLVVGLLASFVLVVVVSLAQLAALLPQYADRADELLQSLKGGLSSLGAPAGQLDDAVSSISPDKVVALIGAVLAGLSATLSSFVFLICLLL